jgi:hypothetical protein
MDEADLEKFLAQPLTMIASDSGIREFGAGVPHPRGYGSNARVLGRYVRDLRIITIEDAVRKMTSLPAKTFRLRERGELKPGFVADLVIFDPAAVGDPSTYADPHHYATGFSEVIVNGVPAIQASRLHGRPARRTGEALASSPDDPQPTRSNRKREQRAPEQHHDRRNPPVENNAAPHLIPAHLAVLQAFLERDPVTRLIPLQCHPRERQHEPDDQKGLAVRFDRYHGGLIEHRQNATDSSRPGWSTNSRPPVERDSIPPQPQEGRFG